MNNSLINGLVRFGKAALKPFFCAAFAMAAFTASAFDTPYLTFRSTASFSLSATKRWDGTLQKATGNPTDEASWSDWTGSSITAGLSDGQYYIYLRGKDNTTLNNSSYGALFSFSYGATSVYCEGDIEALRDYEGNPPSMAAGCCMYMFSGCTELLSAPSLSATTLANECYFGMFSECSSLTTPPVLPAMTMATDCYRNMFEKCTGLKSLPSLPATTTALRCYMGMFSGCSGLEINTGLPGVEWSIPEQVGDLASSWNASMFQGTSGAFTGNPLAGTPYYVASALPFGEIYQIGGKGTLDLALVGFPADVDLASTIKNGTAPYTFTLASGTLPPGLNVSGSTLSGTPTTVGNYSFSLSVTDAESHTLASADYTMQVVQPTIVPTTFVGADGSSITTNCISLTTAITTLNQAWYVASGTLNYGTGGIKVSGDVNLVLVDGASVTVQGASNKAGINVAQGNSLTIYGQTAGTGTLSATGDGSGSEVGGAGIGGNDRESGGTITINGGTIVASAGGYAGGAGIGGGSNGNCGAITINRGTVTATGASNAAGIGGGRNGSGGAVTINGGTVTATAGSAGSGYSFAPTGIGQGYSGSSKGTLTVGPAMSVKAGSTANPTEEIGRGGSITIGNYRYFFVETAGLVLETNAFSAYTNESKNWNLADTISGGTTPYSFTPVTGFEPPSSLALSGTTLSGSVAAAGTYTIKYTVTDSSDTPLVLEAVYTLTVTTPDPITAATSLAATVGKAKAFNIAETISGGVPPYSLAFSGTEPAGFSYNDGVLSGTATEANAYNFTITATDSLGTEQVLNYTLVTAESSGFIDDDPEEPASGDSVDCRTADGVMRQRTCTQITDSLTTVTWTDSWYYIAPNATVTLSAGAIVSGKVSLILGDGATLTIQGASDKAGIAVLPGNTLTIYSQSAGASVGKLVVTGGSGSAGIGGNHYTDCNCGKVTIYGGDITTTGTGWSAGIGGGDDGAGNGGTVAVYGGTVTATSLNSSTPGIGGGYSATSEGTLTVGENVVVKAGPSANPSTVLEHGEGGTITLVHSGRQYYVFETTGPTPLEQTVNAFAVYVGEAFNQALADTVSGGTSPYSFTLKTGTLPTGLSFENGTISGTPTATAVETVVFTVTDSGAPAQSEDFSYTITVTYPPKSITYIDSRDGTTELTGLVPAEYAPGVGATLPATATAPNGYTFAGWYANAECTGAAVTAVGTEATENLTFYAKWTPTVYTITYMDGSTPITDQGLTPTSFTIESPDLSLPATATKAGYGFYGWYDNAGCTGDAVTTIPANSTGDKTFWAKWGVAKSNETYIDASGHEQTVECVEIGSDTTTLQSGWYVVKGNVNTYSKVTISGNVNLVLADGATYTVSVSSYGEAIEIKGDNSLTIYGGVAGTGALNVTASTGPAIGANNDSSTHFGTLTVYGGNITANGSYCGIGGGYNTPGGDVYVYGGTVIAQSGGSNAAGIGGYGTYKTTGTLTVADNVVVMAKTEDYGASYTLKSHGENGAITLEGERYYKIITPKTATVPYRDADGVMKSATCKLVTVDINALETGWYAVTNNIDFGVSGVTISGDVRLVIADGASFAVEGLQVSPYSAGINVPVGSSLTIYGQEEGSGTINAVGGYFSAGIGGNYQQSAGAITINGCNITAIANSTYSGAAGIGGGGNGGNGGTVTINGGRVEATGSIGAGIGKGQNGTNNGTLIVNSTMSVMAGASPSSVEELSRNETTGEITLSGQKYFVVSHMPLNQVTADIAAFVGEAFELALSTTVSGGTPTYSFVQKSGTLPSGLTFNAGVISGTPTATASETIVFTVTDSGTGADAQSDDFSYTIIVTYPPKSITYIDSRDGTTELTGLWPTEYTPGVGATLPATATAPDGYEFAGWYANAECTGDAVTTVGTSETENLTFYAKWTPIVYSVTYMDGSTPITDQGLAPTSFTIESPDLSLPATATKAGYGFYGWYDNSGCTGDAVTTIPANSTGDKTFYAKWGVVKVSKAYIDADGNGQSAECVEIGPDLTTLETGWYVVSDDVTMNSYITVSGDVNIILADDATLSVTASGYYAGINVASGNSLTIYGQSGKTGTLNATGGSLSSGIGGGWYSVKNSGTITINGGIVNATANSAGAAIGGACGGNCGTVTINGGVITAIGTGSGIGGGSGDPNGTGGTVYINGGTVTASGPFASRPGIGGASSDVDQGTLTVGAGVVVKAGSSATLTDDDIRNPNGETEISLTTIYQYYFIEKVGPTPLVQKTSALVAYVDEAASFDLATTVGGGTPDYTFALKSGTIPSGMEFAGSTISGTPVASGVATLVFTVTDSGTGADTQSEDFTYTLTVTPRPKTITYMDGAVELTGLVPAEYVEGTGATLPATATKTGYTFVGWYDNAGLAGDAVTAIGTEATEPLTFYAKWTPVEYTITYKHGDTTLTGLTPASYTMESATITLPTPDEAFCGWYESSSFTGDSVQSIPAGSYGDKTFYGMWMPSVTFIGADGVETSETCTEIVQSMTTWNSGWYVVSEDVTIDSTVTVSGDVNLILADDATLTVTETAYGKAGILVPWGHSLTIYAQQDGTGRLIASASSAGAGIGGCREVDCGRIVVNGGLVTARGGNAGAGIGGGGEGDGGDVFINGGIVTAYGGGNAPGIGAGVDGTSQGTLTLGDNVKLEVSKYLDSTDPTKPRDLVTVCVGGEVELYGDMRYFIAEKGVQASPSTYLAFTSPNPFTIKVDSPSWRSGAGELRYSTDTVNWILWDGSLVEAADVGESYALYFRGTGNSKITSSPDETNWVIDGNEVSCTGDIETLRDWRGDPPQMASMCFYGMFKGCSALVSAPTLSSKSLAAHCYSYMFQDCVNLITIPELPATSLESQCYDRMFNGCTSLRISESAPGTEWALPDVVRASLIVANSHMFQNTGGSFTDSPTNEVYYVKGENDPDVPIQKMQDIYANSSEINIDLRGTLFGGSGSLTFDATADMPEGLSLNAGVLQGALTAGNYPLSLRVTDSHFEKSVNLSYTLHAVASIPEFTQTTNAIGPYSAYILAYSNLKDTLSGYVGTCIFSETHGTQNKLPTGIRLYESGGLSINDKLAAGSYTFDVTVTDGALRTLNCTYVLTIAPNEPAVIDESSPSDGMVTVYGGEYVTFSVTAHDPEEQDMVYYWYLDGAPLDSQGPSYIYSYTPNAYGSVEKPTRTLQCRVWDRNTTVIAKTWTINQPGWRYEITTDTLEDATTGVDYMAQLVGVGHGGDAEWYLADGDRLPPGLAMGVDGVISGRARMAGIYAFTVLREEGNAIVSKELTLEVTGENAATTTFGPLANDSGLQMLLGQTIPGDTIVFADGAEISTLDANDFPGVIFSVPSGTATFVVDVEAPLDAQSLVVAAGAKVVFKAVAAHPYFGHYDLVQMPATMAGSWSVDAPFFFATAPAVGSDGVLGFDALGGKDAEDDTLTVLFPDGPDVRAHELTGFDTDGGLVYSDESSVDGQSVLGSTLTLNGYNRFGGVISQIEGNTAIVLKQGATLDIGSVYELGGSLVFAEGSSFKFGAPTEGAVVSNASLEGAIVPPSSGTASLVLKGTLGDGQSVTVFNYYTGSVESFQLVLPDVVDSTNYSLVRENGCLVVKCAVPLHEGDTGTLTVTGNDSVNSSFGDSLPGYMVTADGGTAPYKWTCPYATYDITREANSFDGSSGAAELAIRQRLPYSQRNIVDLGFDFPFGGYLQNQVSIGLNGCISIKRGNSETGRICVFGDDAPYFATVNDIFVSRSATTATIRFGHRVAVTLASDGKIRVAYGPLAEGAQRRYMPCDIEIKDMTDNFDRVARFEAENGAYNGIDDVVFTQTSMIPGGLSPYANGNMIGLSGIVSAPSGSYPVKFRCVDANGYVIEKTVTVTVGGGNSSLVKSTATTPAVEADGTCHISYGDSQTFTVAGIDPSACRWYEDNVLKETGVLSYTFDSSTGPWPTLSKSSDFDKHTKLVTCRVLDPLYGGQELTVASWQVIVNVTYYIDASVVDSAANGTQEHPFRTIPYNINDELTSGAFPGDVFLFRPGKYKLPFVAPADFAVTLRSTDGADSTIITVDDADKACVMQSGADGASRAMRVEGFTLENAGGRAAYGGTLVNCVLRDSALAADHGVSDDDLGYGGGAYGSRLVNCLVSNCSAVYGGGVAASELRNCTVVCNYADELGGALDGASVAYNTVFWGNLAGSDEHDSSPTEQTPVPGYILPLVPTTYACLYAEDPLLYADGRPAVGSPCIGAGDSSYIALDVEGALYDLAGDARSQVGNVSIGAYENAVDNGPCRIMVKATGAGTVLEAPYADVDYGEDAMFRFRGRLAAVVCTNGVLAAENVSSYVWPAVTQPGELSVTFAPTDLYVDSSKGSFDNDGLSWDSPKYSISDAISSAGDGDVIHVKPGLYGSTYVSQLNKLSNLRIVSTGGRDVTIIDAQHIGSCFDVALDFVKNTSWERHGIVLEGFTLQNGRATGRLGGGGACGGTLVNCIIQNCESIGRFTTTDTACGGGASGSALINCIVRNCRAGKSVSEGTWYSNEAEGGGVWGGYAEKCEIYGNSCWGTTRSEGPGTYETILRDCYVYNNMIGTLQDRETTIPAANAVRNTAGDAVQIRSATREPTTEERNDTTERIYVAESKAYDSEEEAVEAAAKQKPDIATEIASEIKDKIDEYIGMFEIQTVRNEDTGKWENRSVFKEDVKAELAVDLTDALASSIVVDSLVEASTGVTSFVLEDPKPGLYYSVEFSESIGGSAVFSGQRYLSNGHSVRLTVEYRDTPVGYWRMAIYMTPDGED